ncbi:MAG: AraC family transcriptional regulator [Treponema sp.]|nr:AraC family transcriptional regulator [Treponema sp.]
MDYLAHYEVSPSLHSQGLHAHDYFELYLHINGGRQYCVDDTVFELNPYQMIIIPPLHMHGLVCDRDLVNYERCYLYLSPETLRKCGFNIIDLCTLFEEACNNKCFTRQLSQEDGITLIQDLQKIATKENKLPQDTASLLEDFSILLNILKIAQKIISTKSNPVNQNNTNNSIYKVLHFINHHYTEQISISELGKNFNMSESYLSHEFKKYSNKSVYEYILYKRIIKAKELLLTESSLTQIALDCGFNDYSNFLRTFKKFSNCSPKEYKNKLLSR